MIKYLFIFLLYVTLCFADISGTYSGLLNSFVGLSQPDSSEVSIQLDTGGTWYLLCSREYGATKYTYPCDGEVYTWYQDDTKINYPVVLNYPGLNINCRVSGSNTMFCYVAGSAIDLLLSKDSGQIIDCEYEVTQLDEISSLGGVFRFLVSNNLKTCNGQYISIQSVGYANIKSIQYLSTKDIIVSIQIDQNTNTQDRSFSLFVKESPFTTTPVLTYSITQEGN